MRLSVEYKADFLAAATGNAFIETVSESHRAKQGWALATCAQVVPYYVVGSRAVRLIDAAALKLSLGELERRYGRSREVENDGNHERYQTFGILVPLEDLARFEMSPALHLSPSGEPHPPLA